MNLRIKYERFDIAFILLVSFILCTISIILGLMFMLLIVFMTNKISMRLKLSFLLIYTTIVCFGIPITKDTLVYQDAFITYINTGEYEFGKELFLKLIFIIVSFFSKNIIVVIMISNAIFIYSIYRLHLSVKCSDGFFIIFFLWLASPFYYANLSLLLRTHLSISFVFLLISDGNSFLKRALYLSLAIISQFFSLLLAPFLLIQYKHVSKYLWHAIFIAFAVFPLTKFFQFDFSDYLLGVSSYFIDFGSDDLNRKINVLYDEQRLSSFFDASRLYFCGFLSFYLSRKLSSIENKTQRFLVEKIIVIFAISTISGLIFGYSIITLTRFGFVSYYMFPVLIYLVSMLKINNSSLNLSRALKLTCLSVLVIFIIYSFIINDITHSSGDRLIFAGNMVSMNLFDLLDFM